MDPITAFGFAGTVIQFISFSSNLVSAAHALKNSASGLLAKHEDIESITKSLQRLVINIKAGAQIPESGNDLTLSELGKDSVELARGCEAVAGDLLNLLSTLRLRRKGYLVAIRKIAQSIRDDDKIRTLESKLQHFTQQLILSLLHTVRLDIKFVKKSQASLFTQVADIGVKTSALGKDLLDRIDGSDEWRNDLINSLHDSLSETDHGVILPEPIDNTSSTEAATTKTVTKLLLSRLLFLEISDREGSIPQSFRNTFEWINREAQEKSEPWDNFAQWLEQQDKGIYWITGKAGSGKSTLMKYIYHDRTTQKHLLHWSKKKKLAKAAFFFWNSGSQLQMSMLGMLRSLLYQVLSELQHFVPVAFPTRWKIWSLFEHDDTPWTWAELSSGLEQVIAHASTTHNFFFAIDGLDEFDGDHNQLSEWLITLVSRSPNLKVCTASRPWVDFEDAFKGRPNLMLQYLTRADIRIYVETNFSRNQGFREFREQKTDLANRLMGKIINKADGVFLWVVLVVRSLLRGMSDGDKISDLERRLNELPGDLEGLFNKMLASVDTIYLPQTSRLFRFVQAAHAPLTLLCLSLADEDETDFAFSGEVRPFTDSDLLFRCRNMKRRINSRCKGLLEVVSNTCSAESLDPDSHEILGLSLDHCSSNVSIYSEDDGDQMSAGRLDFLNGEQMSELKVQFLHRTVRDFLDTPELHSRLTNMDPSPFDPQFLISQAFLCQLKGSRGDISKTLFWHMISQCLAYASEASECRRPALVQILDELDRVGTTLSIGHLSPLNQYGKYELSKDSAQTGQLHWAESLIPWMSGLNFSYLLAMCDLHWYLGTKLRHEPATQFRGRDRPLLLAALWDYQNIPSDWPLCLKQRTICMQTIRVLLGSKELARQSGINHPSCTNRIRAIRTKPEFKEFITDVSGNDSATHLTTLSDSAGTTVDFQPYTESDFESDLSNEMDVKEIVGITHRFLKKSGSNDSILVDASLLPSEAPPGTWSEIEAEFGLSLDRFEGRPGAEYGVEAQVLTIRDKSW